MRLDAPVKHLLVDLDGTLLANRNLQLGFDFARQSLATLREMGSLRKIARVLLAINKELHEPSSREHTNDVRVVKLFAEAMNVSIDEGRRILRDGTLQIFPSLKKHFYPVKGAREFLDWAKDRYPLTLATNPVWPPEIIELRVQWAGIDPKIFSAITHVRLMHACKPDPHYFREVVALHGLRPEECLLIGDNTRMDLPATRIGLRVFIVGSHREVKPLRFGKAEAPAWRGSYAHLRELLETQPAPGPSPRPSSGGDGDPGAEAGGGRAT